MILRRLGRQPMRAAMTVFGIALSCAILVMGSFVSDTVDYLLEFQFFRERFSSGITVSGRMVEGSRWE